MNRLETMIGYLPVYEQNSQVIISILSPAADEVDQFRAGIEGVLKQFYVETATAWGLDLWEQMLGLKSYAGKPLDQRRSRIISKLRGMGTITASMIQNVAESYVFGGVEVTEASAQYSFTVKFIDTRGVPPNLDDIKAAIAEIKPAHLDVVYEFRYLIWNELDTENLTWDQLDAKGLTWDEYETGGWLNA